jgi:hypothetical protein
VVTASIGEQRVVSEERKTTRPKAPRETPRAQAKDAIELDEEKIDRFLTYLDQVLRRAKKKKARLSRK